MDSLIKKLYLLFVLLIILSGRVVYKVIYLQYFANIDISKIEISFRDEEIEATRGSILAQDGRALSTSLPFFQIRMDCLLPTDQLFNSEIDSLAKALANFYGNKGWVSYKQELVAARAKGNRYKAIGNRLVDYSEMLEIKRFPIFREGSLKGGVITEQKNRRSKPYGKLADRTIGYINNNDVGVGIEKSYNSYLKGVAGKQRVQRMLGGEWVPVISEKIVAPQDGYDILTTLDINIQEATERALKEQLMLSSQLEGGTAIVMEVKSGAIRAIANMKKGKDGHFDESYNYAIGHATEPGSTFKLATLAALIEDGYAKLESPVDAGNGRWRYINTTYSDVSAKGYGEIDLLTAFEKSSNVAFAKMAVEHYANNEKRFVERITNMKIAEKFDLDILGEARALIHEPGGANWSKLSIPSMAIGYNILLTPLHTLTFYNAIANGGRMMKPYFIENIQREGLIYQKFGPKEVSGSICSKKSVEQLKRALRGVVKEGTAKAIDDERYQISGKTGTARVAFDGKYVDDQGNRMHQASFAGFFPSDNPQYTIVVVLYSFKTRDNFYGASWASPVFKSISDNIYSRSPEWRDPIKGGDKSGSLKLFAGKREEIERVLKEMPARLTNGALLPNSGEWVVADSSGKRVSIEQFSEGELPNVMGMGLKDALYLLENSGYKVLFQGRGRVLSQIYRGGVVELKLNHNHGAK